MHGVHVVSLKRGTSHGLWQYKVRGTHDRVMMHGLQQILDKTCRLLGYTTSDRSVVYIFSFSAGTFEGYHVCLERMREGPDGGCYYRATRSPIGDFEAKGLFPAVLRTFYLHEWPERIYFKLERSLTGEIQS